MEAVHDAVLVGIGAEVGDVLVRHDRNVQARLVDDAGLQEFDESLALLRLVVEAGGGAKRHQHDGGEGESAAAQEPRRHLRHW